jgi:protein TonB
MLSGESPLTLQVGRVLRVAMVAFLPLAAFGQQASDEDPPKQAGSDVPAPKRVKTVPPVYPPEAQAQGLRGIVILELVVDAQGRVASAEVVRSVPPFDEAALAAVRKWEYEPTTLDGKAVRVRMTVPISFAMRLPEATRQEGIPELRQGASPAYPSGAQGAASVTAQVTLDAEGRVAEAEVRDGGPPWDEALLQALRTWRFAVAPERGVLSFRVRADFVAGSSGQPPRVSLAMSGLQESQSFGAGSAVAAAPQPAPTPDEASPPPSPPAPEATPEPAATADAAPSAPPAPVALASPPPPPPVEVITAPSPPAPPPAPGVSAVADVTLGPGVPDLVTGRRPVPPPLARMSGTSGTVEVRFSVDAAGQPAVKSSSGSQLLQAAAEDAVRTWKFRRTTAERLHALAVFSYGTDSASAAVIIEP